MTNAVIVATWRDKVEVRITVSGTIVRDYSWHGQSRGNGGGSLSRLLF